MNASSCEPVQFWHVFPCKMYGNRHCPLYIYSKFHQFPLRKVTISEDQIWWHLNLLMFSSGKAEKVIPGDRLRQRLDDRRHMHGWETNNIKQDHPYNKERRWNRRPELKRYLVNFHFLILSLNIKCYCISLRAHTVTWCQCTMNR